MGSYSGRGWRLTLDSSAIASLAAPSGLVGQGVARAARTVADRAKSQVGVDTGRLKADIRAWPVEQRGQGCYAKVGSQLDYALVHHQGRGVVVPRRARVLVWAAGGQTVFARKSRAVGPNHYLTDQLKRLTAADFT